jgi:hypothetical protein
MMAIETDQMAAGLRELADRQQITEALYTYCRAVDRLDRELGYTIWNEGAQVDYGEAIFVGPARGVIDYICASHARGLAHSHQITNVIIRFDGDRAFSEAYVSSAMRTMHGEQLLQINTRGRYLDRWSRRHAAHGGWGIDRRLFICDFNEARPAASGSIPPRVRLDRQDLSYAMFAGEL